MRWMLVLLLTLVAVVLDTTLAASSAAPRCALALLAVVLARWPQSPSLLVIAAIMGVMADTIDPGSTVFHAFFYLGMAALAVLIGERLRGHGLVASMVMACILVVLQAISLALLINPAGWEWGRVLLRVLSTAALAVLFDLVLRRVFREPQRYLSPL